MGYSMKGSPAKLGTIKGTSGHASALKQEESAAAELKRLKAEDALSKYKTDKAKKTKGTPEYKAEQERIKVEQDLQRQEEIDKKAAVDATRGTHKGQVKKQSKLDKIQKRQDKKAYKKYLKKNKMEGDDATFETWKESDQYTDKESKRETRLKGDVAMTSDEYEAKQAEKKAKRSATMKEIGKGLEVIGQSRTFQGRGADDYLTLQSKLDNKYYRTRNEDDYKTDAFPNYKDQTIISASERAEQHTKTEDE